MKTNHRHYILILLSIISVTLSSFVYVFIYRKTLELAKNHSKITNEMNSEDDRKKYEQELIELYDMSKGGREKIQSYITKDDKIVDFIEMVEKIGIDTKTDFELSSINNDKGNIKAKVSAKGSWVNILRALTLIENLPMNSSIKNIVLNTSGNLDGSAIKVSSDTKTTDKWKLTLDIETITTK